MEQAQTAAFAGISDKRSGARESLPPDREQVQSALAAALQSREFQSAPQLRSFLGFVVRAALNDEQEKLKGYTIAVEALGRPQDFNPVTDPIVRVEAARLRRRLADYYTGSGAADPVRIVIPKGSYAPEFRTADTSGPRPAARTGQVQEPAKPCERNLSDAMKALPTAVTRPDEALAEPAVRSAPQDETATFTTAAGRASDRRVPLPVAIAIGVLGFLAGYLLASA
jgi:hypothetical protein